MGRCAVLNRPLDVASIRKDFPILQRRVNGKPLVYLDNSATSQKPQQVIDALSDYYRNNNANIHRAVHTLGGEATEKYEYVRSRVANFIGAAPEEIVFTRNATEALNLVAFCSSLKKGDEVVTTIMEHHSNIVPWQMLESRGVKVNYVDIDGDGRLKMDDFEKLINENTKIVSVTQASNITGTINPTGKITELAHDAGAISIVDGAQSVPHMPTDVVNMNVDFLAFSGHKMLGPTGVGVLYGKKHLLDNIQPFLRGGDMIKEVFTTHTTFNDVPHKFEAGTPNIADVIAFGEAINYLETVGMPKVMRHEKELTYYALERLSEIKNVKIYGPMDPEEKLGVISFNVGDAHSHDIASLLDGEGIAIRSGHGCAMPLVNRMGAASVCRASFYIYNTKEEIDALINAIEKAKGILKIM